MVSFHVMVILLWFPSMRWSFYYGFLPCVEIVFVMVYFHMVLLFLSFFFFFAWKKRSCSAVSGIRHLSLMVVRSRSIESVPSIVPPLIVVVFRGETLSPRLVAFRVVGSFCVFDGTLSLLVLIVSLCHQLSLV